MNYLSPSILSANFSRLGEDVKIISEAGAQYVHIDVMDGIFVPSISFGIPVIKSIRSCTNKIFDVHLMIDEPVRYIRDFAEAGADVITVHMEACRHLYSTIMAIKSLGKKAAVALNPSTDLNGLEYVLPMLDMVLVMSVNPGFGGQKFIPYTMDKIVDLKKWIDKRGLSVDIEVDGGIHLGNVEQILNAGANVIVAGSAIFQGDVRQNTMNFLQKM